MGRLVRLCTKCGQHRDEHRRDRLSIPRAADEQAFSTNWQILKAILEQASYRLTRLEIGMRWPASPPPNAVTLFRWLERTVADGLVLRDGEGVRGFPFRYWLPNTDEL